MSAEHGRLIANLLMLGVVTELDESEARVRVDADGMMTDWIPWAERRAGPGVRTWSAPEVGEQVIIACPYGDPGQAVVLGSVYRDQYPAPAGAKTTHRTEYADGTVVEYDRETTTLTVNVGKGNVIVNCQQAEVHASASVLLDTPTTRATGSISADGNVSAGTGATGTFTTATGQVVTVERGNVTNIF